MGSNAGSYLIAFLPLPSSVIDRLGLREDVKVVAPKAENRPSLYPRFRFASQDGEEVLIEGVIGIVPSKEAQVTHLDEIVKYGSFLRDDEDDGVLLSERVAERLGVKPGDTVKLSEVDVMGNLVKDLGEYRLVGVFDGGLFKEVYDLDGHPVLPKILTRFAMHIFWRYCDPDHSAIFTLSSALKLPSVSLSRVDIIPRDPSNITSLSRIAVLNLGVEAWESISGDVLHCFTGRYVEMKGASFIVPFLLVIGNIFSLMISSIYERRKEIYIMSTLGLNPTHIASIFIAEGLILGLISGCLGYLLGLGSYRLISLLSLIHI